MGEQKFMPKAREVLAYQYSVFSTKTIPGVVYKAGEVGNISPSSWPYIFVGEEEKQYLIHDDWVVLDEDEEGEQIIYVVKPEVFAASFVACEEAE